MSLIGWLDEAQDQQAACSRDWKRDPALLPTGKTRYHVYQATEWLRSSIEDELVLGNPKAERCNELCLELLFCLKTSLDVSHAWLKSRLWPELQALANELQARKLRPQDFVELEGAQLLQLALEIFPGSTVVPPRPYRPQAPFQERKGAGGR